MPFGSPNKNYLDAAKQVYLPEIHREVNIKIEDLLDKCPKCKSTLIIDELVAYAFYDASCLSKKQNKCLSCGHTW